MVLHKAVMLWSKAEPHATDLTAHVSLCPTALATLHIQALTSPTLFSRDVETARQVRCHHRRQHRHHLLRLDRDLPQRLPASLFGARDHLWDQLKDVSLERDELVVATTSSGAVCKLRLAQLLICTPQAPAVRNGTPEVRKVQLHVRPRSPLGRKLVHP